MSVVDPPTRGELLAEVEMLKIRLRENERQLEASKATTKLFTDLLLGCLDAAGIERDDYKPPEWIPAIIRDRFLELHKHAREEVTTEGH